jgi:flagellar hook-associated protein 2
MVKDIQQRIESWDLRLAKRKEMLTRQFSAMETALSSLKNQSTWLAGQINSLPTYS